MYDLIAESREPGHGWKKMIRLGQTYGLGRDPGSDLPVDWDPQISRQHAQLKPQAEHVEIERVPSATNPLFFAGREVDRCYVRSGEHFVVGSTCFHVVGSPSEQSSPSSRPVEEVTFDRRELSKVRIRDADKRIDVLRRLSEVIWGARTDSELYHRLVSLILAGVSHADAVAIVGIKEPNGVNVMHWDRRRETAGGFRPSSRLVWDAIHKRGQSLLHVWESRNSAAPDYTAVAEFDWAFCTPVPTPVAEPWGFYVAGKLDRPLLETPSAGASGLPLQADVKFTEIVAELIGSVHRSNKLERQQSSLRQFFAPPILAALGEDLNMDRLQPRECDVTVMFCDLRGFSQQAEESADDLIGLLDRVSRALEVMRTNILEFGGVPGDFQGDAALGFWGWPFASEEAPVNACRAALGILAAFTKTRGRKGHPLANFETGIGIARGRAVAGTIGTSEQVKPTVFGPVANLASRLESMTKQLRVPILLDEAITQAVRPRLDTQLGRLRKLAKVLPYGMEKPVFVSELLPPESDFPDLTDTHLEKYEHGVEAFVAGRWEEAYDFLHQMPASDRAQDFLNILITQNNRVAPPDWDGIIRLPNK